MSVGSLSRELCSKCTDTTLHDHCVCIHCGTPRMVTPAVESLGYRAWIKKLGSLAYRRRTKSTTPRPRNDGPRLRKFQRG